MKNFLAFVLAAMVAGSAYAGSQVNVTVPGVLSNAAVTVTTDNLSGYIDSIEIRNPSIPSWTGTVTVTMSGFQIFQNTFTTNFLLRPMVGVCTTGGVAIASVYDHVLCAYEPLRVTISTLSTNTAGQNIPVKIRLNDFNAVN